MTFRLKQPLALAGILIAGLAACTQPGPRPGVAATPAATAEPAKPAGGPSKATLDGMQAYNSGDRMRAFRYLKQAAEADDPEGQVNFGYLYARGHGTLVNQVQAMRLYELSAKAGSSEGMNAIGYKYLHGTGVEKDPRRALDWFCQAVALGNPRAMNNLATMLVNGELPTDMDEARRLWQQAIALGHANAMANMGWSWQQQPGGDAKQAYDWMLRAAQAGHPQAQQFVRENGYDGALPPAVEVGLIMTPAPTNATGHSKACPTPSS